MRCDVIGSSADEEWIWRVSMSRCGLRVGAQQFISLAA